MNLQGYYTEKGLVLAAKVSAGTKLTVTKVTAGGGTTAANALTLAEEKQTLTVGTAEVSGQTATLPVTLSETDASASYVLTELGVYASDPDEGEILYQVFRLDETRTVSSGGESVYRFYLHESVGEDGVTVTCSPAGLLTDEDLAPTRGKVLAVSVPSRSVTIELSALQNYLDSLPRLLTEDLAIKVTGSWTGNITVYGFYGSGRLTISGKDGCTLTGNMTIDRCSAFTDLFDMAFQAPATGLHQGSLLYATINRHLWVESCSFVGNGTCIGVRGYISSSVCVVGCPISDCNTAVQSCANARVVVFNSSAVTYANNAVGADVYRGGIILLGENTPDTLGAATNVHRGGIIAKYNGTLI